MSIILLAFLSMVCFGFMLLFSVIILERYHRTSLLLASFCVVMVFVSVGIILAAPFQIAAREEAEPTVVEEYALVEFSGKYVTLYTYERGGIKNSTCYFYYQLDGGGYQEKEVQLDHDSVTIIETDEIEPCFRIVSAPYKYKHSLFDLLDIDKNYRYIIYVPLGSASEGIVDNYTNTWDRVGFSSTL